VMKYNTGFFRPKFPAKYVGDPAKIVFRSLLELKYFTKIDLNPSIIRWGSEEFFIPYWDPVNKRERRYFVDLFIEYIDSSKKVQKAIVEIKPHGQCSEPKKINESTATQKQLYSYQMQCFTWLTNDAKWKAAKDFADKHGWKFFKFTEKMLGN